MMGDGFSADSMPTLKYNQGETAQAIEFWLRAIFEGEQPHAGTGWGTIVIEVEKFHVTDVQGTVNRKFLPRGHKP